MKHPANDCGGIDLEELLRLGVEDHQAGRIDRAEARYLQILKAEPDHAAANHYLGIAAHQTGRGNRAVQLISKAVQADPTVAKYRSNLGLVLQAQGRLDDAVACYRDALDIDPDHVEAHYNLGNARQNQGRADEAAESYHRALELRPEFADAHANLGGILFERGRLADAAASYENTLRIAPDLVEARICLGKVYLRLGRWRDAVECFQQVIRENPECLDAHIQMGHALEVRDLLGDALAYFEAALKIEPGHVEANNSAGRVQLHLGRLDNAESSFRKVIDTFPDNAVAHNNLGRVLHDRGLLDSAVPCFQKAIELDPNLREPWDNLRMALKAGDADEPVVSDFGEPVRGSTNHQIFRYSLESFWPHQADDSFDRAMDSLSPMVLRPISAKGLSGKLNAAGLPERMVALFHSGRSGTGLLHSLIDSHPQISTLPSVYLKGYFNVGVWENLTADGWERLPERFAEVFEVLFDANSRKPVPGHRGEDNSDKGVTEGMTVVGKGRWESLALDRELFCAEVRQIMSGLGTIDPGIFLRIVHRAFDKVLGAKADKPVILYHIHDPGDFARLNFLRHFPDAKLVMMFREPIQNCESWTREGFEDDPRYDLIAERISALLLDFDRVEFRRRDSVGVRLEDLKLRPGETLRGLAAWMGVGDDPALYRSTMQGKKWWGDPSSPDYDKTKAMEPFDTASIDRPVGLVFSERDRLVLGTLFYPFNVRYGYLDPDPMAFERNLNAVGPMLDDMFDFERDLAAKASLAPAEFMRRGRFRFFHRTLIDRWRVLRQHGDYPGMLGPLGGG